MLVQPVQLVSRNDLRSSNARRNNAVRTENSLARGGHNFQLDKVDSCNIEVSLIALEVDDVLLLVLHHHEQLVVRQGYKAGAAVKLEFHVSFVYDICYFHRCFVLHCSVDGDNFLNMPLIFNKVINNLSNCRGLHLSNSFLLLSVGVYRNIGNQVNQIMLVVMWLFDY